MLKFVSHLSVDLLFRRALPELRFVDLRLDTAPVDDWRYAELRAEWFPYRDHVGDTLRGVAHLAWMLCEHLGIYRPELLIVDHETHLLIAEQLQARRVVWYCHSNFDDAPERHRSYVRHWLERFPGLAVIYPTANKRVAAERLMTARPGPALVTPLALTAEAFVQPPAVRNDRVCLVRHNIPSRLQLGDSARYTALFRDVAERLAVDIYGGNNPAAELLRGLHVRGPVPIATLREYSAAVEPFGNESPAACQLELMAAAVPLVTCPREGFADPRSGAYLLAGDAEEFVRQVARAKAAPEIGLAGQVYVRERHGEAVWLEQVRQWFKQL